MTEKYVKNERVAVLVSHGYGAGWSTWNPEVAEEMLFSQKIVKLILAGMDKNDIYDKARELWPNAYLGGICELGIEWIEEGAKFRIEEHDGAESVLIFNDDNFYTA